MVPFFPLRKIKRNGKCLLLGAVLIITVIAAYLEYFATSHRHQRSQIYCKNVLGESGEYISDITWVSKYNPQPWKSEYKGQANLHVFEDWCGSSVASIRQNVHYPLFPHTRLTVKKLAVSPGWTNYGLRIFGYIHPYTNGEYIFAVASGNNCEFWLSLDENPENLQLLAYVGKTGKEWTAPGEYEKFSSQISRPNKLQQRSQYYFELIYKHNDHGTDHVEVAWRLKQVGTAFTLIDSSALSLYTDESSLKHGDVSHIPHTAASHPALPQEKAQSSEAEMLREDPRDTFFQVPVLDRSYLQNVLPDCDYKPSYIIKDLLLNRYQGLHFVHLSYIYPNDYTRLTHMESDNPCFYQANQYYFKRYGFSKYMKLDQTENGDRTHNTRDADKRAWEDEVIKLKEKLKEAESMAYYDDDNDYDDKVNRLRKLLFMNWRRKKIQDALGMKGQENKAVITEPQNDLKMPNQLKNEDLKLNPPVEEQKQKAKDLDVKPLTEHLNGNGGINNQKDNTSKHIDTINKGINPEKAHKFDRDGETHDGDAKPETLPLLDKDSDTLWNESSHENDENKSNKGLDKDYWNFNDEDLENQPDSNVVFDPEIHWAQTFQVNHLDFQMLRNDEIDLNCNLNGNLLISESEAFAVVQVFMELLNKKKSRKFILQQIVNVVKRADVNHGSRYLLELELLDDSGHRVRLVHYVYLLNSPSFQTPSINMQLQLCNPKNFQWNPHATVHIIVPVKNQARWVHKFIVDMEELYKFNRDENFNIIIVDYSSDDMDIEEALKNSHLPKYQYVRMTGNFERSAGLQVGVDLITDKHSIAFLCDLHIHFPIGIIDSVRKHCVEGRMVFAPIVMRLNCGATPKEANGFWEINGFGLLGIYKSDLVAVGGMNTKEFSDSWGGEDWELLDRIIESGLEVERLYLRNFFHYYHSKRGMWNRKVAHKT